MHAVSDAVRWLSDLHKRRMWKCVCDGKPSVRRSMRLQLVDRFVRHDVLLGVSNTGKRERNVRWLRMRLCLQHRVLINFRRV